MAFNALFGIVAGLVGTAAMTMMMVMAPRMGMPEMDMPAILGSMFGAPGNKTLGLGIHFMMGAIFGVIYAALFPAIGGNIIVLAVLFGVVHWLAIGLMLGMMPMMHAGIRSGNVSAPGVYMTSTGGMMGFMGGLMGHIAFGLVVGIVYGLLAGGFVA